MNALLLATTLFLMPTKTPVKDVVVIDRILAIIDSNVVLMSEVEGVVDDFMRSQPPPPGSDLVAVRKVRRTQILDTLISEKLLEAEIKKLRVDVTSAEIDRVLEDTKARNNLTQEQFVAALAQQGLTLDAYREGMQKQLMKAKIVQLKVKNRVQVTDQDVRAMMAKEKSMSDGDFTVRASHILFLAKKGQDDAPAKKKADAALLRLQKGESFAALATEISEGPSAKKGGDLGVFKRGEMVPAFERAAFNATPGKVVGPIKTAFGWHLILVSERISDSPNLAEKESEIRERLYQQGVEREFANYVAELRKKAYIEIKDAG